MPLILELEQAYDRRQGRSGLPGRARRSAAHYGGRPSPLYFAERLTEHLRGGGAKIYFKRDELNHTGSHKINNCLGQIQLARRMGKTRIIAETGAGQHGVAVATGRRALRAALRRLYGRHRYRAAAPQCVPHEAARRRGQARDVGLRHAEGRHERGVARLGRQCATTPSTSSARWPARTLIPPWCAISNR